MIIPTSARKPTDDDWAALLARQQSRQVYAVITTGIVCRTGCPARAPLRKNVLVFPDLDAAINAGFRACKRCKPTQHGS